MPTYTMTGPDGKDYSIDGPAGASQQDVAAQLHAQFSAANPAPKSPHDQGVAAGQQDSAATSAFGQALQQVLPGNSTSYLEAAGGALRSALTPGDQTTFAQHLDYAKGRSEGQAEGSRASSTVGGVAGGVAGLLTGGEAVNAAGRAVPAIGRVLAAASPVANAPVSNVLKSAVLNGAGTFAYEKAKGTDTGLAGEEAAGAAVLGPVVSKLVSKAAPVVSSLVSKAAPFAAKLVPSFSMGNLTKASSDAWKALADAIGESPSTLETAIDTHLKATGNIPSTAQVVSYASQGRLKALAQANPALADAAITASKAGGMPLHDQLNGIQSAGGNLDTVTGLNNARDIRMTQAMDVQSPAGVALRDEPISDPRGVLQDPHVALALRPDVTYAARVGTPHPFIDRIANGQATLGDLEDVRYALRDAQKAAYQANNGEAYKGFTRMADRVEGLGANSYPDYGAALEQYRNDGRYTQGFQHGVNGNAQNAVPAGATSLARDLATPAGQAGFAHGAALHSANDAIQNIAPASITPEAPVSGVKAAQTAVSTVMHGAAGILHAVGAFPNVKLSDSAARIVADQLYNPATTLQGVRNLERAGATNQQIRQLGASAGAGANQKILDYFAPGKGQ